MVGTDETMLKRCDVGKGYFKIYLCEGVRTATVKKMVNRSINLFIFVTVIT